MCKYTFYADPFGGFQTLRSTICSFFSASLCDKHCCARQLQYNLRRFILALHFWEVLRVQVQWSLRHLFKLNDTPFLTSIRNPRFILRLNPSASVLMCWRSIEKSQWSIVFDGCGFTGGKWSWTTTVKGSPRISSGWTEKLWLLEVELRSAKRNSIRTVIT